MMSLAQAKPCNLPVKRASDCVKGGNVLLNFDCIEYYPNSRNWFFFSDLLIV